MGQTALVNGFKKFKIDPTKEQHKMYECCSPKDSFHNDYQDCRNQYFFQEQVNKVVAEITTSYLELQIRKIGLRNEFFKSSACYKNELNFIPLLI